MGVEIRAEATDQEEERSRDLLRLATKSARLFAFDWDPITDIVRRDGDSERILGVPIDEETGTAFFQRVRPQDRDAFVKLVRSLTPQNDSYTTTYRVKRPDGREAVLEESAQAYFNSDGKMIRLAGMTADITDRHRAEAALQAHARLLDLSFDAILARDMEGRIAFWNKGAEQIYGYSRAEALGEVSNALLKTRFPEPLSAIEERLMREGKWEGELVHTRKDGGTVVVLSRWAADRDADGRLAGVLESNNDITERKRGEEALRANEHRFRSVLENMSEGLMLFDAGSNLVYQNPASLRIHGFESLENGLLSHQQLPVTWKTWDESDRLITYEEWPVSRVFRNERFQNQLLRVVRVETGHEFFGSYNGAAILDAEGRVQLGFITIRDITEQRRAEEQLRASEERLRSVLENMSEGVMLFDSRQNLIYQNPASLRINGIDHAETKELSREQLPMTWEVWEESGRPLPFDEWPLARVFRKELFRDHVVRVRRRENNQEFYASVNGCPICDADGKIRLGLLTIHDITEKRRVQENLRVSEERFRVVQELSPDGFTILSPVRDDHGRVVDFVYVYENATIARLNGTNPSQVIGRRVSELLPNHGASPFHTLFCRVVDTGLPEVMEEYYEGDSVPRPTWFRAAAVPMGGDIAILSQDITERKEAEAKLRASEERFRVAQEMSPDGFTILSPVRDEQGKIVDFTWVYENPTIARLNGTDPAIVTGRRLSEFMPQHASSHFHALYSRVAETGQSEVMEALYEGDTVPKPTWFRVAVVSMGHVIAVLSQDITEQRAFQTELQRQVDERTAKLKELVGELEHFSYTITHDMRAPLRALQGFSTMMLEMRDGPSELDQKTLLHRIISATKRMDRLITDALNYNRTVRQELTLDAIDAGALLRGMLETYPELEPSKANIEVVGDLPVVMANEAGLTQCFSNILGNAVKFVKPGEVPRIKIWAEDRGKWVRIFVEDHGIGIPESMLPRVFDMFSRGNNNYEGTGIGLALVRKVMDRMAGKVGVDSLEGFGSRFWLELKKAKMPAASGQ